MTFEDAVRLLKDKKTRYIVRKGWEDIGEGSKRIILRGEKMLIARPPGGTFPIVLWGEDIMADDWEYGKDEE